jgi:transcriptional regulator with XRE-family HTH domain
MAELSQRDFSGVAGISEMVLSQYLNGQSEPTRPRLVALSRAANVSLEWLATGEGARSRIAEETQSSTRQMDFRRALVFTLDEFGIKEADLAAQSGIPVEDISRYCSGRKDIRSTRLLRLLKTLPDSAYWFFIGLMCAQEIVPVGDHPPLGDHGGDREG